MRSLGGDGVGQIAGGRAADGFESEAAGGGERGGHDAILEGERGVVHCVIFEIEILGAEVVSEFAGLEQRRSPDGLAWLFGG